MATTNTPINASTAAEQTEKHRLAEIARERGTEALLAEIMKSHPTLSKDLALAMLKEAGF